MNKEIRKPTVHSMKRRCNAHNYSRKGYYHITLSTTKNTLQPLGCITGQLDRPDGAPDAPHVKLTPIGLMVEEELLRSIHHHYPMLEVQDYVIMPEHIHFIIVAHSDIISQSGNSTHLGHVIAGFKHGCNKRFWAIIGKISMATESPCTTPTVLGDSVAKKHRPAIPLPPLFDAGYCDVMPIDEAQLATQRAYIHNNPRHRLLRTTNRAWLKPQRHTINTAVSLRALKGYLTSEMHNRTADLTTIEERLLLESGQVVCDSYGNTSLLQDRRLLPVVCHRKDTASFEQQKARCLTEAAAGAILVSARISRGEHEIMDAARQSGFPIVLIEDNGFPEIYHPSTNLTDLCATGKLLLLTPWHYQFRKHDEILTVSLCKTMNCIAQAVCKLKDCWWKKE